LPLQLALGSILRESGARELPCGVFGSFGWSGEAVDEMQAKLKDGGYSFAFQPIKVKFKPTAKVGDGYRMSFPSPCTADCRPYLRGEGIHLPEPCTTCSSRDGWL